MLETHHETAPRVMLTARHLLVLEWAFVTLGLLARLVRYILRFPLWEDEAFVCYNLIDRDFADLGKPLVFGQVAPVLFLAAQLLSVKVLGYHELSLRLVSFVCGVASLFLFRHLAGRLLTGLPYLLAVAVFAVAYPGIRYSAEAKPYGSDLFVALVLFTLAERCFREPHRRRWRWLLVAVTPLAVGLSYPSVFVAGGISLWLAWQFRRQSVAAWTWWIAFNGVLVGSFGITMLLATKSQMDSQLAFMQHCWQANFPPLTEPWRLPEWLLATHTSDLMAYPVGGPYYGSTVTLVLVAIGVAAAWRNRRPGDTASQSQDPTVWRPWLLLFALPLALTFVAAALRRYPYGGHVKLNIYMAPAFCLLAGWGAALVIDWMRRRALQPDDRSAGPALARGTFIGVAVLAAIGLGSIVRDVMTPYKTAGDDRARAFARWFWTNAAHQGEVACVATDLGETFSPDIYERLNYSALYFCNRRIYAPRGSWRKPIDWQAVAPDRPLRCVIYQAEGTTFDESARARWLADMSARWQLKSQEEFCFLRHDKLMRYLTAVDRVRVYTFTPPKS